MKINQYTLILEANADLLPFESPPRKNDPMRTAERFSGQLGDWLEENLAYGQRVALAAEPLSPASDGTPRVMVICTPEVLSDIIEHFGSKIVAADLLKANVGSEPSSQPTYPKGKNCWKPR